MSDLSITGGNEPVNEFFPCPGQMLDLWKERVAGRGKEKNLQHLFLTDVLKVTSFNFIVNRDVPLTSV